MRRWQQQTLDAIVSGASRSGAVRPGITCRWLGGKRNGGTATGGHVRSHRQEGNGSLHAGVRLRQSKHVPTGAACRRFQIGSITKQFTAAAVLQLQKAGALNIHSPVVTYLSSYAFDPRITLRMLLNQTSGLHRGPMVYRSKSFSASLPRRRCCSRPGRHTPTATATTSCWDRSSRQLARANTRITWRCTCRPGRFGRTSETWQLGMPRY